MTAEARIAVRITRKKPTSLNMARKPREHFQWDPDQPGRLAYEVLKAIRRVRIDNAEQFRQVLRFMMLVSTAMSWRCAEWFMSLDSPTASQSPSSLWLGVMTEFYGWGMNTKASHDPCVFVDCGVGR